MGFQSRASASKPQKGPSPDDGHTSLSPNAFQRSQPTKPPYHRSGAGHFRLLSNVPYELSTTKLDQSPVAATTSGVDMKTCLSCRKGFQRRRREVSWHRHCPDAQSTPKPALNFLATHAAPCSSYSFFVTTSLSTCSCFAKLAAPCQVLEMGSAGLATLTTHSSGTR